MRGVPVVAYRPGGAAASGARSTHRGSASALGSVNSTLLGKPEAAPPALHAALPGRWLMGLDALQSCVGLQ